MLRREFHKQGNLKLSFKELVNLGLWKDVVGENLLYIIR